MKRHEQPKDESVSRETLPGLARYAELVAAAPMALTGARDADAAWDLLVADALAAAQLVGRLAPDGAVDVGSGNGSPGIPLAAATGVAMTLLEARAAKAAFLRELVARLDLARVRIVHARSEDHARGDGRDAYDLALARALAPPPAAAELSLPLVRPGGHVVLFTAAVDAAPIASAAAAVGGELVDVVATGQGRRLVVLAKVAATPERFPRRPGMATKRPLARLPSPP